MDLSKLSDKDLEAVSQNRMDLVSDDGLALLSGAPAQPEPSLGAKALDAAGRVLDYTGGLGRTAFAGLANIPYAVATGKSITKEGDVLEALKGNAPTTSEFMERAGVPAGASLSDVIPGAYSESGAGLKLEKGGVLDPTARGAAGFVGDVLLDPATYATFGSSALAKKAPGLAKAATAASDATTSVGKKIFKSGLKEIDEKVIEKGAKPVSELLWEKGGTGTTKQIQSRLDDMSKIADKQRKALYQIADTTGATVDMRVALKDSLEKVQKMKSDPGLEDLATRLEDKIIKYMDKGNVPVATASEWKTNLRNALPDSAFDKFGKVKSPVQKIEKSMASGLKTGIEESSDAVMPGLGGQISKVNEEWQTILTAKKPVQQQVKRAGKKNLATSVDMMLLGTAGFGNLPATAGLLGAKKLGDLSKTTGFRTSVGRAAQAVGSSGLPDYLLRRSSPWMKMDEKE
jgi:hypothetical protein